MVISGVAIVVTGFWAPPVLVYLPLMLKENTVEAPFQRQNQPGPALSRVPLCIRPSLPTQSDISPFSRPATTGDLQYPDKKHICPDPNPSILSTIPSTWVTSLDLALGQHHCSYSQFGRNLETAAPGTGGAFRLLRPHPFPLAGAKACSFSAPNQPRLLSNIRNLGKSLRPVEPQTHKAHPGCF